MKRVTVDFPVVSWGSVQIEVEDHLDEATIRDLIEDDEIEIVFDPLKDLQSPPQPLLSLYDFVRGDTGEVPVELEVSLD